MRVFNLEVADNLTTESFTLARSGFIENRGHVKIVTPGNRSSFIGG